MPKSQIVSGVFCLYFAIRSEQLFGLLLEIVCVCVCVCVRKRCINTRTAYGTQNDRYNIVRDRDSLVAHIKRSLQVRTRALGYH